MYRKSFRARGRGRAGGRIGRPAPYDRQENNDTTIPKSTPDERLSGSNTTERAIARAKDDARVARDWKSFFERLFERDRYTIPRPPKTHLTPEATSLNEEIDNILKETKTRCKDVILNHLDSCIQKAEERANNPPKSADEKLWETLEERLARFSEVSLQNMVETVTRTMIHLTKHSQQASSTQEQQSPGTK